MEGTTQGTRVMMRKGVLPLKPVSIRSAEPKPRRNRSDSPRKVQSSVLAMILPKVFAPTISTKLSSPANCKVKKGSFTLEKENTTIWISGYIVISRITRAQGRV